MANEIRLWGLTGGIASGKSTAAKYFAEEGLPVIDADQIARDLSKKGREGYHSIVKRFGVSILATDGEIDRGLLRQVIFSDPKAKEDLESILHPLIQAESKDRALKAEKAAGRGLPVIYEAALLVETGRYRELAGLFVVTAHLEKRIERLMKRDSVSREMAERMIQAQATDEQRRQAATLVIENDGTEEELRAKIKAIAENLYKSGKPT